MAMSPSVPENYPVFYVVYYARNDVVQQVRTYLTASPAKGMATRWCNQVGRREICTKLYTYTIRVVEYVHLPTLGVPTIRTLQEYTYGP